MYAKIFIAANPDQKQWVSTMIEELMSLNSKSKQSDIRAFPISTWHSKKDCPSDKTAEGKTQLAIRNNIELVSADLVMSFGLPNKDNLSDRSTMVGLALGAGKPVIHYGIKEEAIDFSANVQVLKTISLMKERDTVQDPNVFAGAVFNSLREMFKESRGEISKGPVLSPG